VKRFKFPVRNTEEGSAVPGGKFGPGRAEDINSPYLFTEPASLGVELPVLKK
jgi:adenylylsulfate reductase subunit B